MTPSPSLWTPAHVAGIAAQHHAVLPVLQPGQVVPMVPGLDLWDMWQLAHTDGSTVLHRGRSIWFFLAAPQMGDPDLRHDHAHVRTLTHGTGGWHDLGPTFPAGFTPGSREWSGSAVLEDDARHVTHYFTAAGRRGEPLTFEQRLFETRGSIDLAGPDPLLSGWSMPVESVTADGRWYRRADQASPIDGRIKGFRDPGFFRDPADGTDYLTFTGSAAWVDRVEDGVIGLARRDESGWRLLPPPVSAVGTNSELERAHVVARDGLYYLFWSTQRQRFSGEAAAGVSGLYAMVADSMAGPWRPANGTALVAANPPEAPTQAYCWWVTGELHVISFVDMWGVGGDAWSGEQRRARFGGTAAPFFRLHLDGDRVTIAE